MQSIFEVEFPSIEKKLEEWGEPSFHAKQIWSGVYQNFFTEWDQFTMLSKSLRENLNDTYALSNFHLAQELISNDQVTQKFLFQLRDGKLIESVLIFTRNRVTVCISTQSGCAMGCAFCATGKMGLLRNLTFGEIIEQIVFFLRLVAGKRKTISNIVFMGMGEPFANYENLKTSLEIIQCPNGIHVGSRHITVSTIGIIPRMIDFANHFPQMNLAVSLHAATNELRSQLVPLNNQYPIENLISTCKKYIEITNRRVSFEYVLLGGINDSAKQALELVKILQGLLCHVNLIPLNPVQGIDFIPPNGKKIRSFYQILLQAGIPTTIRRSQGQDIKAGCGQLAGMLN